MPLVVFLLLIQSLMSGFGLAEEQVVPSFRRDVMPVLFRAGCNAGTCHGSARGKDGFMLSLFGYDPAGDYRRIVEEIPSRRINIAVPEESLLLLKATASVSHTGGKLFTKESELYQTLLAWIVAGAPDDPSATPSSPRASTAAIPEVTGITLSKASVVFESPDDSDSLRVTAHYSDGSTRDVTMLSRYFSNNPSVSEIDSNGKVSARGYGDTNVFARYSRFTVGTEVIVLPPANAFVWPNPPSNNFIDRLVFERLEKLRIAPSDLCDDETFLRRVTLDLIGRPPKESEYWEFINDKGEDKRARTIDKLLASDDFAEIGRAHV